MVKMRNQDYYDYLALNPPVLESFWLPDGVYAWKTLMADRWVISDANFDRFPRGPLGKKLKAQCFGPRFNGESLYPEHDTPSLFTHGATPGCGFYGMKLEYIPEPMRNKAMLIKKYPKFSTGYFDDMPREKLAVVKLEGTIIEHDNGFRASHQTIVEFGPEWDVVKPYKSLLTRTLHARKLVKWFDYIRKEYSNG